MRVESGEKRVVDHRQDVRLHLYVGELFVSQSISVDDFESEVRAVMVELQVFDFAKEDSTEVAGAELAEELEVGELKSSVRGEVTGGFDDRPMWVGLAVRAVGERTRVT